MKSLQDRVALITGAGSGLGRADAVVMASRGAAVVVNDINAASAEDTVAEIRNAGGQAIATPGDISDARTVADIAARGNAEFGKIDILVNNAGIGSGRLAVEDIDGAVLERMLAINVKGAFLCTQAVLAGMKARRFGKIVNISSVLGTIGGARSSHYAAAKGALLAMTKTWAREFAPWNITVNALAPGGVFTGITAQFANYANEAKGRVPLGRFAQPEEIAYLVAFLASAEADYITGQVISPNGGEVIT